MCGIAGVFERDGRPAAAVAVGHMTDAIAHRGPDGAGVWVAGPVGLGHRRLAIIDLSSAGNQPMVSADGRYVLSFNGEIYNFQELKATLKTLGYRFQSRTDSEVLLYAFAAWGTDCLPRLNGMFAFAVWDTAQRRLTLARDRYGIKPLYYAERAGRLLFGSEIHAILAHPGVSAGLDTTALVEYFTFQNILSGRTLWDGIHMLPAGSYLQCGLDDPRLHLVRWWDYHFAEPAPATVADPREYAEELERLFTQAVNRMLVADVDVGAYLSGGLDSGSITAVAAPQLPCLRTFTVGFDLTSASGLELIMDERPAAERLSYLFGTEHYEMVLKAGDMERCHAQLVRHIEEPRVGQSYPNWYAAKLASRFVRVVLCGTGGDELFGGYPWRYRAAVGPGGFADFLTRYFGFWNRLVPADAHQRLFAPLGAAATVDTRGLMADILATSGQDVASGPAAQINAALYFEARTFLHGLLTVEDKLSMAHGLEWRVPFLDNDLVDFALHVPVALKLHDPAGLTAVNENDPLLPAKREQKTNEGKLLLRAGLRMIPPDTQARVKQGFSAPDASWFRGESIDFVRARLFSPRARLYDWLDRAEVQRLVQDHLDGRTNRRLFIWSLLVFDEWLRQCQP